MSKQLTLSAVFAAASMALLAMAAMQGQFAPAGAGSAASAAPPFGITAVR